ncbi:MAG TPA: hypothetical protein VHT01_08530 [Candidatus Udaeobacter sp.]|jgi:predicted esterase|nr:hypothetical protein [Candidatus Udaeobacter sp.]
MTDSSRVDRPQAGGYSKHRPDFIHEFIPAGSSRTLLLRHGIGGNERGLIALGRELDPNAALLSPRRNVLEREFLPEFEATEPSLFARQAGKEYSRLGRV